VARLAGGETVNIEGYELPDPLYRQVTEFRLHDALKGFAGETLLLQVNQGDVPTRQELLELSNAVPGCHVESVREEQFWKEIKTFYQRAPELTQVSQRFLEKLR
jgi:hypothetical protein